jgi:hypothetical protein
MDSPSTFASIPMGYAERLIGSIRRECLATSLSSVRLGCAGPCNSILHTTKGPYASVAQKGCTCRASLVWRGDPNPTSRRAASSLHAQSWLIGKDFPASGENAASPALVSYAKSSFPCKGARDPRFDPGRNGHGVSLTSLVGGQLNFW